MTISLAGTRALLLKGLYSQTRAMDVDMRPVGPYSQNRMLNYDWDSTLS